MCGRFTLATPAEIIAAAFDITEPVELRPRYNIAPSQDVVVVRRSAEGGRRLAFLRWGLIPSWAKDPAIGNRMINARAETLAEKPAYRGALRARRCLVLADGFYEWQATGARKQPYHFRLRDGRPFGFAGLWERWSATDSAQVESCTIVTTSANEVVRPVHDRMPVIVPEPAYDRWLAHEPLSAEELAALLDSRVAAELTATAVSLRVNNPANDDPGCLASA